MALASSPSACNSSSVELVPRASEPLRPLAVELYAGRFGWGKGFVAEGFRVIGFDIAHEEWHKPIPEGCGLVMQDVLTLHGSQFKDAAVIVASPPCQFWSRMAMPFKCPWKPEELERRKALSFALWNACWRIQREASEAAAGRHIPMVVENVCGAQKWVGRAAWHYGSFYLWGDVPALMPSAAAVKVQGFNFHAFEKTGKSGGSFQSAAVKGMSGLRGFSHPGSGGKNQSDLGGPNDPRRFSSKSPLRKAASAAIAEIPFDLARHIARVYKPAEDRPYTPDTQESGGVANAARDSEVQQEGN